MKLIDLKNWKRREYFEHYLKKVPCTYSMTLNLDITSLLKRSRENNLKLYAVLIHAVSIMVNRHEEFRTALNEQGEVGIFEEMHPAYTIFHAKDESFSCIWTRFSPDLKEFHQSYLRDIEKYSQVKGFLPQADMPANTFNLSMLPWSSFTGFNLNLPQGANYLLPIFTLGKYFQEDGKTLLPISIQVHHAVCDGFHVGRFVNELQEWMNEAH